MNYKEKFSYFRNNAEEIYFDSAATSIKFDEVIKAQSDYDLKIAANTHNSLFDNAYKANTLLKELRTKIADFIGIQNYKEIIFTSGATYSLNQLVFGLKEIFKEGDEILLTELEHSSNLLPWMVLAEENKLKINYFKLSENFSIDISKINECVTKKTKIVSFAMNSNTIGIQNDVINIVEEIKKINANTIIILDLAQSIAHNIINLKELNVDAVAFSAHKMYGPFGLGILWAKQELLKLMKPILYGGGNNSSIFKNSYKLAPIPEKFEAGTLNLSAIYAYNKCIDVINELGMKNLIEYEKNLKMYFKSKINEININKFEFYNLENDQPILLFNLIGVNAQDFGSFLNKKYKISVRVGKHCARLTSNLLNVESTIRVSFSIYNTKQDIDTFIEALKDCDDWINEII
ncbi:aminotransferase class V-fold PLP-dependent enzyme [Spiroplasma taiwanense]|uniref:cysteine desulfurase n=1 Tax=Spiroplasma taiwanense CT-1 TaxID=1276220 RepID=S5M0H1_9MOLU|nr:aminotransferase class V-fold PLP-dependent enzyme [Spiroplasma taiwanense]AGR41492.1 cysteine desulfurase [Spiroplasma taiwanense CT-1]